MVGADGLTPVLPNVAQGHQIGVDQAVLDEAERLDRADDAVDLQDVWKCFSDARGKDFWASNGVTLGIGKGEAFGLLGPNGAGTWEENRVIERLYTSAVVRGILNPGVSSEERRRT